MLKDKIYITDRQAFIEWKRKYTNSDGKFYAECGNDYEEEPKSYPCILLEIDEYNNQWDDYNIYYYFVYLTDFISDYGK
jgi:hypothetical protein